MIQANVYGIIDTHWCLKNGKIDENRFFVITRCLLQAGICLIQLRAKKSSFLEIQKLAEKILPLIEEFKATLIINDYPEIAKCFAGVGVHLGQEDGDLQEARLLLGEDRIIGRSTHSLQEAQKAMKEGANYIGFGPIFETPTKPQRKSLGLDALEEVMQRMPSEFPIFAIGGLDLENLQEIISVGGKRVAMVRELIAYFGKEWEEKIKKKAGEAISFFRED